MIHELNLAQRNFLDGLFKQIAEPEIFTGYHFRMKMHLQNLDGLTIFIPHEICSPDVF